MNSPLRRKADQLASAAKLPQDNWLAKRVAAIEHHKLSVATGIQALRDMGRLLLAGRISTDLLIEHTVDIENRRASDELGHISCSVIPSLPGVPRSIPHGRGFSWTPDVALQLTFAFADKYDYTKTKATAGQPQPTGDVQLRIHARSWGRIADEEAQEINRLGNGTNTWAEYGSQGHDRNGTHVSAVREPGEILTQEEAETMLAPLALHVIDYFELTGKTHLAPYQRPGNFTSR